MQPPGLCFIEDTLEERSADHRLGHAGEHLLDALGQRQVGGVEPQPQPRRVGAHRVVEGGDRRLVRVALLGPAGLAGGEGKQKSESRKQKTQR